MTKKEKEWLELRERTAVENLKRMEKIGNWRAQFHYRGMLEAFYLMREMRRESETSEEKIVGNFIELTETETERRIHVNVNQISVIYEDTDTFHTILVVGGGEYKGVKESYEEVKKLIEEANA